MIILDNFLIFSLKYVVSTDKKCLSEYPHHHENIPI